MYSIPVFNSQFSIVGEHKTCAGLEHDNKVLSEVVRWQLANRRFCPQHVKNRSMISGAHRKLWRQKGTGRARQGDGKACHFRGGGSCFKIFDREYKFKLNKKYKNLALKMMFHERKDNIVLFENFSDFGLQKTRDCLSFIKSIRENSPSANDSKRFLFLLSDYRNRVEMFRGSKNLHYISIIPASNFSVVSSVGAVLIMDLDSIKELETKIS